MSKRPPSRPVIPLIVFGLSAAYFLYQCVISKHAMRRYLRSGNYKPYWRAHAGSALTLAPAAVAHRRYSRAQAEAEADTSSPIAVALQTAPQDGVVQSALLPDAPMSLDDIPDGPVPLPELNVGGEASRETAGAAWIAASAWGMLNALPVHLRAMATYAVPQAPTDGSGEAIGSEDTAPSIFTAKRKGAWMGCSRDYHLVCKGVYRSIKRTNAIKVVDTACDMNVEWLPHIVQKLKSEFRLVQLTCVVRRAEEIATIKAAYKAVPNVQFATLDPFTGAYPNGTDMVIAYRLFERETLIRAMQFFKNLKAGAAVTYVTHESFPDEKNAPSNTAALQINTATEPFSFPSSVHEYSNTDEQPGPSRMQIVTTATSAIFEGRTTPKMHDLIDPRKRHVLQ